MPHGATVVVGPGSMGAPRRSPVRGVGYRGDAAGSASWPRATASCRSAVLRCHNEIAGRRPPSRAAALSASAASARSSAADRACSVLRPPLRRSTISSSSCASSPAPGSSGTSAPHHRRAASKAMRQSVRSSAAAWFLRPRASRSPSLSVRGPLGAGTANRLPSGQTPTRGERGSEHGRAAVGTGMPRRRASRVRASSWAPAAV